MDEIDLYKMLGKIQGTLKCYYEHKIITAEKALQQISEAITEVTND